MGLDVGTAVEGRSGKADELIGVARLDLGRADVFGAVPGLISLGGLELYVEFLV
jgi:hypothetical protein